jgi:hypothetical protein
LISVYGAYIEGQSSRMSRRATHEIGTEELRMEKRQERPSASSRQPQERFDTLTYSHPEEQRGGSDPYHSYYDQRGMISAPGMAWGGQRPYIPPDVSPFHSNARSRGAAAYGESMRHGAPFDNRIHHADTPAVTPDSQKFYSSSPSSDRKRGTSIPGHVASPIIFGNKGARDGKSFLGFTPSFWSEISDLLFLLCPLRSTA